MEIWILFYVISSGGSTVNEGHPLTSGTIEFGSRAACEAAKSQISGTRSNHREYVTCIASGRTIEVSGANPQR